MQIHQLPEHLANKIAAGEVVERPASVIKELIENSIDAQSTVIKVELKEAGLTYMNVTDNGNGIAEADAKRAFLRHATSKIRYDADLFHIKSLGFRGEALASIAAVSKLTLKTSDGNSAGTMLYLTGGEVVEEGKSDARKGTEIIVEELFYNTPARLKYMKSIHTELGHITDLINRYALAHPQIRFSVTHNGKEVFASHGSNNILQVIRQIYGMQITKNMIHMTTENLDFKIEGWFAKPEVTRANKRFITLIVNGRYIKNYALTNAIIRAYDTLLPIHRFPVAVVHITLDPILIDVNVHPTKLEVRFSKEKELIALLEQMIRKRFRQTTFIPKIDNHQEKKEKPVQHTLDFSKHRQERPLSQGHQASINDLSAEESETTSQVNHTWVDLPVNEPDERFVQEETIPMEIEVETEENPIVEGAARIPVMYPIGQLQGTYILAQNEIGFYMIDQHAAQERIKYEFFKKALGKPANELQQLFIPLTFEFTTDEILFIQKHQATLEAVGLKLEPFGENTYAVREHPRWLPSGLEEAIIRDMIEQIIQTGSIRIEEIREEVAILMACKKSIKANHYLTEADMTRLLSDLRETEDPFTCPHGRPVIIHHTYYEIEKMFKRIM